METIVYVGKDPQFRDIMSNALVHPPIPQKTQLAKPCRWIARIRDRMRKKVRCTAPVIDGLWDIRSFENAESAAEYIIQAEKEFALLPKIVIVDTDKRPKRGRHTVHKGLRDDAETFFGLDGYIKVPVCIIASNTTRPTHPHRKSRENGYYLFSKNDDLAAVIDAIRSIVSTVDTNKQRTGCP